MELGSSNAKHNIMMQDPMNMPYNGENNLIPAEHQDHGTDVASSCATSTKQPPVVYQDTGATKSINFISSSSAAHAPVAVSAHVSQANSGSTSLNLSSLNILTHANLFSARPDQHVATAKAAPAAVPGDRGISKINLSANISLNSCNDNDNSAANITNVDRADEHTNDRTHAPCNLTNPVTKKSSDKFGSSAGVRYRECLKNHAANMGGYAVDGCGEFMPSGERDSIEALKCAACGCHRNFHRREVNGGSIIAAATSNSMSLLALPSTIMNPSSTSTSTSEYGEGEHHNHTNSNMAGSDAGGSFPGGHYNAGHIGSILTHPHHHHHHQYMHAWMQGGRLMPNAAASAGQHAGILPVHYGGSQGPGSQYHYMGGATGLGTGGISGHGAEGVSGIGARLISTAGTSGKRFRTKFTMEQREKMFEFSEKVGWRIHKQDEAAVQQFCAESGVKRHVLKVWMHNNKNTFGKKLLRFPEAFNALPRSSA